MKGNHGINLSEEILRQGLAFVYESKDGKFPHPDGKEGYMKLMHEAQYVEVAFFNSHTPIVRLMFLTREKGKRRLECGRMGPHWRRQRSTRNE